MSYLVTLSKGGSIAQSFFARTLEALLGQEKGLQVAKDIKNYFENKTEVIHEKLAELDSPENFPIKFVVTYFPPYPKSTQQVTNDMDSWSVKSVSTEVSRIFETEKLKSSQMELSHYPDRSEIIQFFKDEAACQQYIAANTSKGSVKRERQVELGYKVVAKIYTKV